MSSVEADTSTLASRAEWTRALDGLLARERVGSAASDYLAEITSREQFTVVVTEFALDGLTEAKIARSTPLV